MTKEAREPTDEEVRVAVAIYNARNHEKWPEHLGAPPLWSIVCARAAIAAMPSWWRPIDEAPKDGTPVDLWCIGEPEDISFYSGQYGRAARVPRCVFKNGAWRPDGGLDRLHQITVTPTHFMPLPSPPEPTP
jgi:hypothetical protein